MFRACPRCHQLSLALLLKMGRGIAMLPTLLLISLTTPTHQWLVDLARRGPGNHPRCVHSHYWSTTVDLVIRQRSLVIPLPVMSHTGMGSSNNSLSQPGFYIQSQFYFKFPAIRFPHLDFIRCYETGRRQFSSAHSPEIEKLFQGIFILCNYVTST